MGIILAMSWRNIWRNKVRSVIIIASVTFGLFAGLFVLGLYEGMMDSRVRTVIDTEVAHLQMHHPHFEDDYEPGFVLPAKNKLTESILKNAHVKTMTTRSVVQGMLANATGTAGVQINGIEMTKESLVSHLGDNIIDGKGLSENRKNSILVGKKLVDKLKLRVGSKVILTFTDKESNIVSAAFRIEGIFQTDNTPRDERNVFVHQTTLNSNLSIGDDVHEIAVLLYKDDDVEAVTKQLQEEFPEVKVESWTDNSPETELMVSTVNQYSYIIMVIIMFALAFGIINTMLMAVLERTREIGMLGALGMNHKKLFVLVLMETILLTIAGAPIGLLISWLVIQYFGKVGIDISSFAGEAMSSFGYSSIVYPEFPASRMLGIIIIVVGTALVSSLFPSIKALKLQPADALRQ
ncbi:FtsX-like permease family protein [Chryseolinea sp. H1M3-3]|uniref:ABC transporter permease n=1 Tax=Chryseolinea sp. H1M3-3 TaxID=3034144 RepID=UPI0023EAA367|nr:FtsX-like permease family protein [Chryseolinea sp. H1M3-3]